ncbi:putative wsc domain-containing protein [Achaetomium macrosporum]|uniref:Wsc domain-containing protein n=1 Tax=Achaetomium macrosporum TaxID=79813 RepID=A0AAN7C4Z7_9PEZI|nr:putative wsc domain-containing protein [Achaetomium macrosporum]
MKSITFLAAALAALADAMPDPFVPAIELYDGKDPKVARAVKGQEQPITTPILDTPTVQGCFKSSGDLILNGTIKYNSIGACATDTCYKGGFAVGGSTGGNQCWCGNSYPPKDDLVDDGECNVPCTGFGDHACGGIDTWTIYNTGLTLAVKYKGEASTTSKASASSTTSPTSVVTMGGQTVIVTTTPTSDADSNGGGGTNTGGVVAGVVVAVVLIAAAVAGGFFYIRRKRNLEIEEEHRRNAAVSAFIGKPPGSSGGTSMTDSRLDPVMAQRRLSDGSIADNQDYSRRILRVTNA